MQLLIDTHVLLWWFSDPSILTQKAKEVIEDINNNIFVSVAVPWEIIIKKAKKKLKTSDNFQKLMLEEFNLLPINMPHVMQLQSLPVMDNHKDPFDRIMIAQAQVEKLTIVTRDGLFKNYDVPLIVA